MNINLENMFNISEDDFDILFKDILEYTEYYIRSRYSGIYGPYTCFKYDSYYIISNGSKLFFYNQKPIFNRDVIPKTHNFTVQIIEFIKKLYKDKDYHYKIEKLIFTRI